MISRRMILLAALSALTACQDDKTPYLEFSGGGFVFNYRTADHYYGFVAQVKKTLPEGGIVEARFEVPNAAPDVQTEPVREGQFQYMFRTANLRGIVKDHPYKAVLVLRDAKGVEVARYEKTFQTDVDQSTLPTDPLVVGPAYQKPPGG